MTKERLIRLWIGLTILSLTTLVVSEGFHGLKVFVAFGTIGLLYIGFSFLVDG